MVLGPGFSEDKFADIKNPQSIPKDIMKLTAKKLEVQSKVKIDKWIDIDSEEWKELDDEPAFTKKVLRLGFQEPAFLFTDSLGRIWGEGEDGSYYPFHFNVGKKLYGYRISKKAKN